MPSIIDNRTELDTTVRIFDSFYSTDLQIPTNQYDTVYAYFRDICPSKNIADNFTVLFFRIAQEAQIEPIALLENLQGSVNSKIKLDEVMTYYFNTFKSKTSLWGLGVLPKPNLSVARNIVL